MPVVKTAIPNPKLKEILGRKDDKNTTIRTLVRKWWKLAEQEQQLIAQIKQLEEQLFAMRTCANEFVGGRRVLEETLLVFTEATGHKAPSDEDRDNGDKSAG